MIYLINSDSMYIVDDEVNKIITTSNVVNFNYDEVSIKDIMEECMYFSLSTEKKFIVVNHFKFDASSKDLCLYLDSPSKYADLILIADTIDKRTILYKKLIEVNAKLIEFEKTTENKKIAVPKILEYAKKNNIKITDDNAEYMYENNLEDYDMTIGDINKICIITKDISKSIIDKYGISYIGKDTFELASSICSKDKSKIKELFVPFEVSKKEVIPFVALLFYQFKIMYMTKYSYFDNYTIMKYYNAKSTYGIEINREKANLYSKRKLEDIIKALGEIDYTLKTSSVDPYGLLKMFIITYII